jgi:two-component system cell cycle sensor histidine kinase/response regulator CckA
MVRWEADMLAARERILLVDDEPQMLVALEDLLSDDYAVLTSDSGERALDLMAQDQDIAVLITDQRMPSMTGDELLTRVGQSSDATRILITGYAELSGVIRAVNAGKIFAYLTKPWNDDELLIQVRRGVEHFRLARELSSERRLLQDLMDGVPDGIFFKDAGLRFLRVNSAFAAAAGVVSPEVVVGKRLSEILPGPKSEAIEAEEALLLARGEEARDVLRSWPGAGEQRWFSDTKAALRNLRGAVIGLVGISREVTDRVRTSEALQRSERRLGEQGRVLHSILAGMGDGAVVIDQAGKFLLFNPRAERILGFGAREMIPGTFAEIYGLRDRESGGIVRLQDNPLCRALSGEESAEAELLVRNDRVKDTYVSLKATPLRDDSSQVVGSIGLFRDVTEQRRLERQLLQAQKMEAIGKLAGGVAHDFNNMLSVILSYSDIALSQLKATDPLHEDIESIKRAGQRAAALTRQLLAFSRQQVLALEVIDLNDVVRETEHMLERVFPASIEICAVCAGDLARVRVDPGQVQQVLMNLAVNARDAMEHGGKLTIQTANARLDAQHPLLDHDALPGNYVLLTVSDTGTGMDKQTQAKIFEPFFTTKEPGRGTGLGLATVFGIVKQSGGYISVHSEPGSGTTFKIYLPSTTEAPSQRPLVTEPSTLMGTETVLVTEDQDEVRKVVRDILRLHGYQVIEARNGGEALLCYEKQGSAIDLLLTDVVMPQVTGPELVERLRKIRPGLCVLYMSGYTDHGVVGKGTLESDIHFIQKPIVPAALLRRVREVLNAEAGRQERPQP